MPKLVLVVHNIRSAHNVGSILRTADGLGVYEVYLTGYTPYPAIQGDGRLPHLASKIARQIHKTALGAEESVNWEYQPDIKKLVDQLKNNDYKVVGLEQAKDAVDLDKFKPSPKLALIVGNEVEGISKEVLAMCDNTVAIPMAGQKESFNVAIAAAIALYHLANA